MSATARTSPPAVIVARFAPGETRSAAARVADYSAAHIARSFFETVAQQLDRATRDPEAMPVPPEDLRSVARIGLYLQIGGHRSTPVMYPVPDPDQSADIFAAALASLGVNA